MPRSARQSHGVRVASVDDLANAAHEFRHQQDLMHSARVYDMEVQQSQLCRVEQYRAMAVSVEDKLRHRNPSVIM